ncbi:MAG: YitT family protein [Clostridia bacterium]|nr:YitT family protein [Clostridia bacterium]
MKKETSLQSKTPNLTKKEKTVELIKTVLLLLVSTALFSFAAYCLIEPNQFTIGGIAGIAIMLSYATDGAIPQSGVVFCANLPLIVLAFFFVKKKFAILTCAHIVLQSFWLFLFERLHAPEIVFDGGTKIFAAIAAGVCLGTALAIVFKLGGSSGGADIIAVVIQKKFPAPSIAWMLFIVSAIVVGASFFVFYDQNQSLALNLLPIMMSLFELYIESKINDSITNGFQSAIEFRIITDKPEEMAAALMQELQRGSTAIPAKGMYTGKEHTMVVCVIGRKQVTTLRKVMRRIDPEAFAVMSSVSQVVGLGFYSGNED